MTTWLWKPFHTIQIIIQYNWDNDDKIILDMEDSDFD